MGAGRFAVATRFTPASGNLLHHAIEMFLKGSLAKLIGVAQIPHHHQLETLWNLYRQHHADPALDQYTTLIEALHRFEGIRYPDKLIKEGGLLSVGFPASTKTVQTAGKKLPEYHLVVAHIDTLVKELFARDKLNPDFFGSQFNMEHAHKYFDYENASPSYRVPSDARHMRIRLRRLKTQRKTWGALIEPVCPRLR